MKIRFVLFCCIYIYIYIYILYIIYIFFGIDIGVMLSRVMRFGLVERGGPGDVLIVRSTPILIVHGTCYSTEKSKDEQIIHSC